MELGGGEAYGAASNRAQGAVAERSPPGRVNVKQKVGVEGNGRAEGIPFLRFP